jgi:hypothetical protein
LLFFGESFPVHIRATGSSASGQVGAIIGGLLITATVAAGAGWINTNLWWGDPHPGLRPAHLRRPERRPGKVGKD